MIAREGSGFLLNERGHSRMYVSALHVTRVFPPLENRVSWVALYVEWARAGRISGAPAGAREGGCARLAKATMTAAPAASPPFPSPRARERGGQGSRKILAHCRKGLVPCRAPTPSFLLAPPHPARPPPLACAPGARTGRLTLTGPRGAQPSVQPRIQPPRVSPSRHAGGGGEGAMGGKGLCGGGRRLAGA